MKGHQMNPRSGNPNDKTKAGASGTGKLGGGSCCGPYVAGDMGGKHAGMGHSQVRKGKMK